MCVHDTFVRITTWVKLWVEPFVSFSSFTQKVGHSHVQHSVVFLQSEGCVMSTFAHGVACSEARLWNEVFLFSQDYIGIPTGCVR